MFKSLLLFSAAILLALSPSASLCATPPQTAPAPPAGTKNAAKATADGLAKAKTIYQIDCAMCHGDNGNGKTDLTTSMNLKMDDWSDPASLTGKDDDTLFQQIRTGKDQMPPEDASRAKDSDVRNLIIYIRDFSKGQQAVPTTASK